jgi:DNA modification methylase
MQQKLFGQVKRVVPSSTLQVGDFDVKEWRAFPEIWTDSLWVIPERDNTGAHTGYMHGNFIPQIPRQAMMRYTKRGDVVVDTFLGSGTTLIECKRLGRHGIGIELLPEVAAQAERQISLEDNPFRVSTKVITGDARESGLAKSVRLAIEQLGRKQAQLLVMHPPYHDIIKFSQHPNDLCNARTTEEFLAWFKMVVQNTSDLLDRKHYLVVVIGDKYLKGEWVPLGFYVCKTVMDCGYKLKSIVVKNMTGNRAKRNLENLWRVRALKGGFYIFKHEYVLFFRKP